MDAFEVPLPVLCRVGDDDSDLLPMILFFREPNMLFLRSMSLMLLSVKGVEGLRQHGGLLKTETAIFGDRENRVTQGKRRIRKPLHCTVGANVLCVGLVI